MRACHHTAVAVDGQVGAAGQASSQWHALRAATDIQFAPVAPPVPRPPMPMPAWLQRLGHWLGQILGQILEHIFKPVARALGVGWLVMQWLLIAGAIVVLALLAWRFGMAMWRRARVRIRSPETAWAPDPVAAAALLADADRLAQQGRYDEAAHVLLQRSCDQISAAHPGWLHPASTAREIAGLAALPASARTAFAVIADRVEASRYALRALIEADWHAARAAYAQFALQGPAA